jgi:Domain of unknown function (DUF1918)
MHAHVGDRLRIHGRSVGQAEHSAQIIEIHERPREQPILTVRYDDGRQTLICPGPGAIVNIRRIVDPTDLLPSTVDG